VTRRPSAKTFHLCGWFAHRARVSMSSTPFSQLAGTAFPVRHCACRETAPFPFFPFYLVRRCGPPLCLLLAGNCCLRLLVRQLPSFSPTSNSKPANKNTKPRCEFVCDAVKVMAVPSPPPCSVLVVVRQQLTGCSSSTPWTGTSCSRGMKRG
jgi:hypothetical protein